MAINILHISDLHLEPFTSENTEILSRFKEANFKSKFFKKIKNNSQNIDYIIITGDLSNKGKKKEYVEVSKFLKELSKKLNVDPLKFIICPGNHDVNWDKNMIAYNNSVNEFLEKEESAPSQETAYTFQSRKFEDFKEFYDKFYDNKREFDPKKSIFYNEKSTFDNIDVQICALNSCYRESFCCHQGYINHEQLTIELEDMDKTILKIFALHHIPVTLNEPQSIQNWDSEIKFLCTEYNIRVFIFGHQHKSQTFKLIEKDNEYAALSVGTLGKQGDKVENTFNILSLSYVNDEKQLSIKKTPFQYSSYSGEDDWREVHDEIQNIKLSYEKPVIVDNTIAKDVIPGSQVKFSFPPKIELFSEKLVNIIQINQLYSSGHFHWTPFTRTLGLIDTYSLLSNRISSKVAKGAILELYNHYNIESDCVIGIGQEGIILGSFLACNKALPFTSIPYHSRKKHHSNHEAELKLEGMKKITFLTDVAYTGMSIKDILKDEIFKNVERINLISLFYISKEITYQHDIFKENDPRLKFYTVCDKIRIDKCNNDLKNGCSIFDNKLEKVYNFCE